MDKNICNSTKRLGAIPKKKTQPSGKMLKKTPPTYVRSNDDQLVRVELQRPELTCMLCNKPFSRSDSLKRHIRNLHEESKVPVILEYDNKKEGKSPLILPLEVPGEKIPETKIDWTGTKREIGAEKEGNTSTAEESLKESSKSERSMASSFLNTTDDGLILIKLPVLTSPPKSSDCEEYKGEKGIDKNKKPPKFLESFEEGFLGKLRIYKSGQMRMKIGSEEFNVSSGTSSKCHQEVACVKVNDREGEISILGEIKKKLIVTPQDFAQ